VQHEQQEMIPKTPKEAMIALTSHIQQEIGVEQESYQKRSETHKARMKYFEQQIKNCETALAAVKHVNMLGCDEDGVVLDE